MAKRKVNKGSGGKKGGSGRGPASSDSRLKPNYAKLARNMQQHGVPKKVAMEKAKLLQHLRESYVSGRISKKRYADSFYDDFYDPLYEAYEYDIDEDYSEEE